MMAEPLAAALHGVAKHYHGFTLGPLNLEIPAGSIVGLIGENGAGKTTSGLDPAARSEILDILLDFIQDERRSVLLSSHITTDLEQIADTIAYLHHGQLLFAKNKDDLMEEYGILRCSQQDLDRLPPEWIAATCRTAAGCESLVHPRVSVLRALPGVVCDAASIDDIMRLTSKEG